ncbi:MAG: hypothetical protein M3004_05855, partial [Bacteroidota bacterium]|nr:hypothetical protein [Bacteroidota bacterium]
SKMPATVTFRLPKNWQIATGLEPTNNQNKFFVADVKTLLDCPVLIGKFKTWNFDVNNIPHKIVYWSLPNATEFDKSILLNRIKKIVHEAKSLFKTFPYKHYTFLLQDGAYAALEHSNSVTIGVPSNTFYRDTIDTYQEIAHEYFHAWNLMALHPEEYSDVNYGPQEKAAGLWWSEGLSMFYADLLLRRAKITVYDSTRIIHLEKLIENYFSNPGNAKISPEKSSLETNEQPGGLGDYYTSVHLQGEVIGAMLDLIVRDATNNKQSIDGVMRKMFQQFSGTKGFYGKDIEQTVKNICNCDVHSFFSNYVYHANEIDFNKYLKLIGHRVNVTWKKALDDNGNPLPDLNIFPWIKRGETVVRIGLTNPENCWGQAGLDTGNKILKINSTAIRTREDFFHAIRNSKVSDVVKLEVEQNGIIKKINVMVTDYNIPAANITSLKNISQKQKDIFKNWNNSK